MLDQIIYNTTLQGLFSPFLNFPKLTYSSLNLKLINNYDNISLPNYIYNTNLR